jgi:hypothetical protein
MPPTTDGPAQRHIALERLLQSLYPGSTLVAVEALAPDRPNASAALKAAGYGAPLRVRMTDAAGAERSLVFHTETANAFGHDRRSDRAGDMLLAYDTFGGVPAHVSAVDVGAIERSGALVSLREAQELYLLSDYVEGEVYAEELRRVGSAGRSTAQDVARAAALADLLVEVHAPAEGDPARYRRALRDLVGHGEGIYGMIDAYPSDVAGAPPARLRSLEERCATYRWSLRDKQHRLSRVHGDFHPFNIVVGPGGRLTLLDTSRGSIGDPADDVACLSINHVFFALESPGSWREGFRPLWRAFWGRYLERRADSELLDVVPPYFAWRALVVCNPLFYPSVPAATRDALLGLAERWLDAGRAEPDDADRCFP